MIEPMRIRQLSLADLPLLGHIDRAEHQQIQYLVENGQLISRPIDFDVPGWDPVGTGAHSVANMIEFAQPIVARGGVLLGAFVADAVAGVVIVEAAFEPDMAWLALLHVDRAHRRHGVASELWDAAVDRVRAIEASHLYVSATPSGSAVGFYLSRGCRLATGSEVNDGLYDLEPDDIHLICELQPNVESSQPQLDSGPQHKAR
ncbi:MAG: GNAT family N-acetyltransferase [bacterium]|nr:GNAT family N-acetyltransferase [bacterium]